MDLDFAQTTDMLMGLQREAPALNYEFDELYQEIIIRIRVEENVPHMFHLAAEMFKTV